MDGSGDWFYRQISLDIYNKENLMNLKSSLALATTALLVTGAAFAADTISPSSATPQATTPSAGLAQTQTDGLSKDATTTTTTQESTTGTSATETQAQTPSSAAEASKDASKAAPAVETSAAGSSAQTTDGSNKSNHVEKLFHMFQQDKQQSQAGATTPEAKPGDASTSNPAAKTAQ